MARENDVRIAPTLLGVLLLMVSAVAARAQTQGGGTGPLYPVLKVTVTAVDEEAAQGGHVSPMRWHEDILDFTRLYANEEEYHGHLAAKVQCQLVEVNLNGWTRQSVVWTPNETQILILWAALGMPAAPTVGSLLHKDSGIGTTSTAFNYHLSEGIAGCDVVYTKPGHANWVQRINADTDEIMLAVGGPLNCGVFYDDERPFWDSGFKNSDEESPGVFRKQEDFPWYLDRYDLSDPFEITQNGQWQQFGVVQLRYASQPEFVTQLLWQFEGEPAVRYYNGSVYVVEPPAKPLAIRLAAMTNTETGAIRPAVRYKGTYRGENFDFGDLSEDCPPPGTFTLNEHYYRYTGHKAKTIESASSTPKTPTSQPSGYYNAYTEYWLRVRDESGREMMGTWVQERWDEIQLGPVLPNANPTLQAFYVNTTEGFHWITGRGQEDERGVFLSPDYVGYGGVPDFLWAANGKLFEGTHVYWAGTKWATPLVFDTFNLRFLPNPNSSPPAVGSGRGINIGTYLAIGRTKGPSHTKVDN